MKDAYFVVTKSGHEVEISTEQKTKIQSAITRGQKHITVNGNLMSTVDVAGIYDEPKPRKGQWYCSYGQWHLDSDTCGCYETRRNIVETANELFKIKAGPKCHATNSIQKKINEVIKTNYPHDWSKRIQDLKFRESVRKRLKVKQSSRWCDYKSGECVCV